MTYIGPLIMAGKNKIDPGLEAALAREPTGHVYFVLAPKAKAIKIGFSNDPRQRFDNLCTGSPVPLEFFGSIPGTREVETKLHKMLKHLRLHGEWFRECDELRSLIEDLAEDYDPIFAAAAE